MADLKVPGVYVELAPDRDPTISGVTTSIAAFVGEALKGPANVPQHIHSAAEYERLFGAPGGDTLLSDAVRLFFLNGGTNAYVVRVLPGMTPGAAEVLPNDPARLAALDTATITGIRALDAIDPFHSFNILSIPGGGSTGAIGAAQASCETRGAFYIVDTPAESSGSLDATLAWVEDAAMPRSANAAVYFPWLLVPEPRQPGYLRAVPPSGAIAGLYARTDIVRGVWKPPAGIDASIRGATGITVTLTDQENAGLNQLGVNAIRSFPDHGIVSWGARTLAGGDGADGDWNYVPVRRMALFLERTFDSGTEWAVFEPNGEPLWARLRSSVTAFLQDLYRQGAFQGDTPSQAYLVKCDAETTTQIDIDNGIVNILVGFAPLRPAEFVILRITRRTAARS